MQQAFININLPMSSSAFSAPLREILLRASRRGAEAQRRTERPDAPYTRRGLSLIEMLVAMALTILTVAILSQAFVIGLQTLSKMKAIADLDQDLRTTVTIFRKDLKAAHFEGDRRLSRIDDYVWINQGEIPIVFLTPDRRPFPYDRTVLLPALARLYDVDGDGVITFADLNYRETAGPNAGVFPNSYLNQVKDVNRNGRIDAGDLLFNMVDGGWAGDPASPVAPLAPDTDGNGRIDDIIGGFSPEQGFFSLTEGVDYGPPYFNWTAIREGLDGSNRASERDIPYLDPDPTKREPPRAPGLIGRRLMARGNFGDSLHFTARLAGNRREEFFYGRALGGGLGLRESRYESGNVYSSQWAEIILFLTPDPQDKTAGSPATPLFHLHRRQLLLMPEAFTTGPTNSQMAPATITDPDFHAHYDLSAGTITANQFVLNTPGDVQFRERRFNSGGPNPNTNGYPTLERQTPLGTLSRAGADLLLTNVISCDIKVWDEAAVLILDGSANVVGRRGEFVDLGHHSAHTYPNLPPNPPDYPPDLRLASNERWNHLSPFYGVGHNITLPRVYDTYSSRVGFYDYMDNISPTGTQAFRRVPYPYPIQAIQIKIRVWDPKTEQAREVTIVQDM